MATLVKRYRKWAIVWWQGGKQVWRSTGTEDEATALRMLAEVTAARKGERQEYRLRRLLEKAAEVVLPEVRVPLVKAWELYLDQPQGRELTVRSAGSKRAHMARLVKWTETRPGVTAVQDVTQRLAMEYMRSLAGRSGQTRNNVLSNLKSVWDVLRVPAGLGENPWEAVPRVRATVVRREALSLDQVRRLYGKAGERENWFWRTAIALGFHTGLRWGDVCTLTWEEVDWATGVLRVLPRKVKGSRRSVVFPLAAEYAELLRAQWPGDGALGPVWPDVSRRYVQQDANLAAELAELFAQAGIVMWREATAEDGQRQRQVQVYGFHSLRHTYVTLLEEKGLDRETIQALVGHGSPSMTEHYSHAQVAGEKAKGLLPLLEPGAPPAEPPGRCSGDRPRGS